MTMIGASTEDLSALGSTFTQNRDKIESAVQELTSSLSVAWVGNDGDNFRSQWEQVLRPSLSRAAVSLAEAAKNVQTQARQQEETSSSGGGALGASIGAGALAAAGISTAGGIIGDSINTAGNIAGAGINTAGGIIGDGINTAMDLAQKAGGMIPPVLPESPLRPFDSPGSATNPGDWRPVGGNDHSAAPWGSSGNQLTPPSSGINPVPMPTAPLPNDGVRPVPMPGWPGGGISLSPGPIDPGFDLPAPSQNPDPGFDLPAPSQNPDPGFGYPQPDGGIAVNGSKEARFL